MKINKAANHQTKVQFHQIPGGNVCRYEDQVYIKRTTDSYDNCINLSSLLLHTIEDTDLVTDLGSRVTLENGKAVGLPLPPVPQPIGSIPERTPVELIDNGQIILLLGNAPYGFRRQGVDLNDHVMVAIENHRPCYVLEAELSVRRKV